MPCFSTLIELEAHLRSVYASSGYLPDEAWRQLTVDLSRRRDDGMFTLHYDPQILQAFSPDAQHYTCWDRCATCVCNWLACDDGVHFAVHVIVSQLRAH